MPAIEDIEAAVLDCAKQVLKKRRPNSSYDLDRPVGAEGYMFDDWVKLRTFAEEIVDCVELKLEIPDEDVQLPMSYPPQSLFDKTLLDLCIDLTGRINAAVGEA